MPLSPDDDFIIHSIFVDDMKHVPTLQLLLTNSWRNTLGISRSQEASSFIGLEVEQSKSKISLIWIITSEKRLKSINRTSRGSSNKSSL